MRRRSIAIVLSCLAIMRLSHQPAAGGEVLTPLQTQSIPATSTNWGPGTTGMTDPLTFAQFNPGLGKLSAIDITISMTIHNNFILVFDATPIPTTIYVATTQTTDPSVLADPTKVSQLTDGPTVTLFSPNGSSQIFGGPGTTIPVDVVSRTESSGTWSSLYPITNPNYIAPNNVELSLSRTLNASNATSVFSEFIGTGSIDLPISATAYSSFYSDTANGGGTVLTTASATVTLQYVYASSVPEASGLILLGLGMSFVLLARSIHPRAASPGRADRP